VTVTTDKKSKLHQN